MTRAELLATMSSDELTAWKALWLLRADEDDRQQKDAERRARQSARGTGGRRTFGGRR